MQLPRRYLFIDACVGFIAYRVAHHGQLHLSGWIQTHDYEQLRAEDHSQHPSGRVGKPEDIARMCLFLCEENNDFINGENITIDGGMDEKDDLY